MLLVKKNDYRHCTAGSFKDIKNPCADAACACEFCSWNNVGEFFPQSSREERAAALQLQLIAATLLKKEKKEGFVSFTIFKFRSRCMI